MKNILDEIIAHKREEVREAQQRVPHTTLQAMIKPGAQRRPFFALFEQGPVLIGEIKPKSPSHGALTADPLSIADRYAKTPINCISVLTDERYFGGSLDLLTAVRARVPQTIFRKEFVVDVYQIYETAAAGADAVLLIASVLDEPTLTTCIRACDACGLGYLVEVHTAEEVASALRVGARVIGINNRNLDTLAIDLNTTETLIKMIPPSMPVVSESGIETVSDVVRVKKAGVRGILVGASLLKASDTAAHAAQLQSALT